LTAADRTQQKFLLLLVAAAVVEIPLVEAVALAGFAIAPVSL
jgi:hypothetical protein